MTEKMKDLYAELGVHKDADAPAIKRAYRKKSMEHHPDRGGDPKKFQSVALAYRVLSDDERRKRYDNGESPEASEMSDETRARATLVELFVNVIESSRSVEHQHVIQSMRDCLGASMGQLTVKRMQFQERIKKHDAARKRVKRKAGDNLLATALGGVIRDIEKEVAKVDGELRIATMVLDWLKDYDYVVDKVTASMSVEAMFMGVDWASGK